MVGGGFVEEVESLGKEPRFGNRDLHGEPSHASVAVADVISKSRFPSLGYLTPY